MSDDTIDGRDKNGGWTKGHCPNPNGRPRKKPPVNQADVMQFKQTLVDATVQGQPVQLTRHELLFHKMYENTLEGSVLVQRKPFDRFEQSDDTYAEAEFHLRWLGRQICEGYDKTGKLDERLYDEYRRYYYLIHHDQLERIAATALSPYAGNARTHSEKQIKQIADSIARFGFTNPVLIDDRNGIIAGHGRVLAAKSICAVPALVASLGGRQTHRRACRQQACAQRRLGQGPARARAAGAR